MSAESPAERPPIAPIGRRIGAHLIDSLIIGVVLGVFYAVMSGVMFGAAAAGDAGGVLAAAAVFGLVSFLLGAGWLFLLSFLHSAGGSPGQRLVGVRVRRLADGSALPFGPALGRNLVFALTSAIVIGPFTPLFDSSGRRQGWHDKVAGAVVVQVGAAAPAPTPTPDSAGDTAVAASPVPSAPVVGAFAPTAPAGGPTAPPRPPLPVPAAPVVGAFAPPAPAPAAAPGASDALGTTTTVPASGLVSEVPGVTRPGAPAPAPVPAPAAAPATPPMTAPAAAPADEAPVDETIVMSDRARGAAPPAQPVAAPAPGVVLRWDDDSEHVLSGASVFGRDPGQVADAVAVAVPDATRSLSKTHFRLEQSAQGVVLTDLHSTNGVAVDTADGVRRVAAPGTPVVLQAGERIVIGDRSFTIEERP